MKPFYVRMVVYIVGLMLMSYGISLTIQVSHLGVSAWDVLNLGLLKRFGMTVGIWSLIISIILVVIVLFVKPKYVSWGTLGNTVALGPLVDLFLHWRVPYVGYSIIFEWCILFIGIVLFSVGGGIYVAARFGAGPRDSLVLMLGEMTNWDIGNIRLGLELFIFLIGAILGGPIFIGTILFSLIVSRVFKYSYKKADILVKNLEGKYSKVEITVE